MSSSSSISVVLLVCLSLVTVVLSQFPGGGANINLTAVTNFGKNPTNCRMFYWKPTGVAAGTKLPAIVASHYCGANAKAAESWYKLTPKASGTVKFMVIFPENSHSGGCWEPWNADAMKHDVGGDTLAVAEMVRYAVKSLDADPTRIYLTGFSSGASMSSAMGAVYPELFEGLNSFSGVPPGCIDPAVSREGGIMGGGKAPAPSTCFGSNYQKTIDEWGKAVRGMQSTPYTGRYPRAQIYHGNNDELLDARYYFEEMKIWLAVHNLNNTVPQATGQNRYGGTGVTPMIEGNYMQGTHALTYNTDAVIAFFGLNVANFKPPGVTPTAPVNACATTNGGCAGNAACTPTATSRTCACNAGFTGDGVMSCTAVPAPNACKTNNGGCDAINGACTLSGTTAACKCNTGFTGDGKTCTKTPTETPNACKTNNGGCDKTNAACSLAGGTAISCKCNTGFTSTDNGKTCVTTPVPPTGNACSVDNGGCDAEHGTCTVAAGSATVRCTCKAGYTLGADRKACQETAVTPPTTTTGNKCKTNNGGCDAAAGICSLGADGTTVTCSCQQGFKLASNKKTCTVVDSTVKCTATSCLNGGVCAALGVCECTTAWGGLTCSTCDYTETESGECIQDQEENLDATATSSGGNTQTYIIIGAIAAVVLIGLGVYFLFVRPKASFNQNTNKMMGGYPNTGMSSTYYNQQQPYQPSYQPQPPPPPGRY